MKQYFNCGMCLGWTLFLISSVNADLITGQILLPDGKPAANAQAWVQGDSADGPPGYRPLKVNQDGRFQEELNAAPYSTDYFGRVVILHPDYAPGGGALQKDTNVFHLRPALPLKGRLVDENNQPMSGVKVKMTSLFERDAAPSPLSVWLERFPLGDQLTVVSNEQGQWQINAGVANGTANLEVLDPRFQRIRIIATTDQEVVTRLLPAATLTGRVLYEDGKPAEGVHVSAQSQNFEPLNVQWAESVSGADGSFSLNGLSDTVYNVTVSAPKNEWVAAARENVVGKAGQTVAFKDFILVKGALIEGQVTDESGQPIKGVSIGGHGPHRPASSSMIASATTDEKGFYRLRVMPGGNQVYVMGKPQEFLDPEKGSAYKTLPLTIKENETRQLPFVLKRGLVLQGKVVDRSGQPVKNVSLSAKRVSEGMDRYRYDTFTRSGDDGSWKAVGMVPGKWKIEAYGTWESITPVEIDMPHSGEVSVRVQPVDYYSLRGRVVSYTGQPVGGANIVFSIRTPDGRNFSITRRFVVSNAQGIYELDKLKRSAIVSVIGADKEGFQFSKGGELLKEKQKFDLSDVVMVAQNARLAGRVIDGDKRLVSGARLFVPGEVGQKRATTGKDGKFQLENLPQGFVEIIASHPEKGVVIARQMSDGADVDLQLVPVLPPPGQEMVRAVDLLQEAMQSGNAPQAGREWGTLIPYDFEEAVRRATNAEGKLPDSFTAMAISFLTRTDPAKALTWGTPRLDEFTNGFYRSFTLARLGIAVSAQNPQLASDLYDRLKAEVPPEGMAGKTHAIVIAQLAAALRLPESSALVDKALAGAGTLGEEHRGYEAAVAAALAVVDIEQAKRIIEKLQGDEKNDALMEVAQALIRRGTGQDLVEAQKFWQLGVGGDESSRYSFAQTAQKLIMAIGPKNPQSALEIARRVTVPRYKPQVLASAALFQEAGSRRELLQEAGQLALGHQSPALELSKIAILAHPHDSELSRELARQALQLYRGRESKVTTMPVYRQEDELSTLALAVALDDPLTGRELLEEGWLQTARPSKEGYFSDSIRRNIALAMANLDFERAIQMARELKENEYGHSYKADTIRQLARWVLTDPEKRSLLWLQIYPELAENYYME